MRDARDYTVQDAMNFKVDSAVVELDGDTFDKFEEALPADCRFKEGMPDTLYLWFPAKVVVLKRINAGGR